MKISLKFMKILKILQVPIDFSVNFYKIRGIRPANPLQIQIPKIF